MNDPHRNRFPGLDPDEQLRAHARASFRGAWGATVRSTFSLAAGRVRMDAFALWEHGTAQLGFAPEEPEMVLGATTDRLVAWRTSFLVGRPVDMTASMPIANLYDVVTTRHGMLTGVSFVTAGGGIIEVEAMRGRALRRLASEVQAVIDERRSA